MALIASYLMTTKNLEPFFNSLITAKAPDVFTQKFLENLEFKSTNRKKAERERPMAHSAR